MRLIDGDALFDKVYEAFGDDIDGGMANLFMGWINEAPTLTPPNEWVSDENFNQPLEKQYECTGGWKVSDPATRPFKFSREMEDWEYHG